MKFEVYDLTKTNEYLEECHGKSSYPTYRLSNFRGAGIKSQADIICSKNNRLFCLLTFDGTRWTFLATPKKRKEKIVGISLPWNVYVQLLIMLDTSFPCGFAADGKNPGLLISKASVSQS